MSGSNYKRRFLWSIAFRRLTIVFVCMMVAVVATGQTDVDKPAATETTVEPPADGNSPSVIRWRKYGDKLTKEDLAGPVPQERPTASVPVLAYVDVAIRYEFKAKFTQQDQQVTATLTEIEIYSAVDRQVSWLYGVAAAQLLDHLQGHFDLVEIETRKARTSLQTRLSGSLITGEGRDRDGALDDLRSNIEKNLQSFKDRAGKERDRYEQVTRFGTRRDKLRIERRKHGRALHVKKTSD
jgi:hypothetical protein